MSDDKPISDYENERLEAAGYRPAGGGTRPDGTYYVSYWAPGAGPSAKPEQRTRAEWRAIIAALPDPAKVRAAELAVIAAAERLADVSAQGDGSDEFDSVVAAYAGSVVEAVATYRAAREPRELTP